MALTKVIGSGLGAIPAISGANLTNLDSADLTGALPAISGAALTGFTDAQMPAGSVVQVIYASSTTEASSSSTTYIDTGLTAAITPSASSSKILIIYSIQQFMTNAAGFGHLKIVRGSTDLVTHGFGNYAGGSTAMSVSSFQHQDSPSTTSATTYKIQFNKQGGGGSVISQYDDTNGEGVSTMILMEIAG